MDADQSAELPTRESFYNRITIFLLFPTVSEGCKLRNGAKN